MGVLASPHFPTEDVGWKTARMRVLCPTTATDGHFGLLAVLAQPCAAADHEVRVAAAAEIPRISMPRGGGVGKSR